MDKIMSLTAAQHLALAEEKRGAVVRARAVGPTNWESATAAAVQLGAELGLTIASVVRVHSPQEGAAEYDAAWAALGSSLGAALATAMPGMDAAVAEAVRRNLGEVLQGSWEVILGEGGHGDTLAETLAACVSRAVQQDLDALCTVVNDRLLHNLSSEVRSCLRDTHWNVLSDAGRDALWAFTIEKMETAYTPRDCMLLRMHQRLAASCFALWLTPTTAFICARPSEARTDDDDDLLDLQWNQPKKEPEFVAAGEYSAWLVERGPAGRVYYLAAGPGGTLCWSPEIGRALQLAQETTARMLLANNPGAERVVEHMWSGPLVPATRLSETPIRELTGKAADGTFWIYRYLRADRAEVDMGPYPTPAACEHARQRHADLGALVTPAIFCEADYKIDKRKGEEA